MSEQLFTLPRVIVFDTNAALVSGAKANFYIAGTLTRQNTYTDSALTVASSNPVIADGNGVLAPIYLDATLNYKVDITDSLDSSLADYPVDNITAALTATEVGTALYPVTSDETAAAVTPTVYSYPPGDVRRYGAVAEVFGTIPSSDSSSAFRQAIDTGHKVIPPEGAFRILPSSNVGLSISSTTVTSSATNQNTVVMEGAGAWKTELWFDTTVESDIFIDLTNSSNYSKFSDIRFRAGTAGKAWFVRIIDELDTGQPNWKNTFTNCRIDDFFKGCVTTSDTPLDGAVGDWCSETFFENCKLKNCRTAFLNQNIQAVNTTLIGTDIENDDSGEAYVMFRDEAGGETKIYGGSFIGKGPILQWEYPSGGTNLMSAGKFEMNNPRIEARSTHAGVLFEQLDTTLIGGQFMSVNVNGGQINGFTQTLDLLQYGGRCTARFNGVDTFNGTFIVRQYPTSSLTATSASIGSLCKVDVDNCPNVYFEKATSSAYGTYAAQHTGPVSIRNTNFSTGGAVEDDGDGFLQLRTQGPVTHFGFSWQSAPNQQRLIYNDDDITAGLFAAADPAGLSLVVPKYARCLKLFAYKHPQRFASAHLLKFYYVKDNADWVDSGTFALATDAKLAATISSTVNSAGYFEQPIVLVDNSFGTELRAGFASWTEGKIYIERSGSTATWVGYVGVEIA